MVTAPRDPGRSPTASPASGRLRSLAVAARRAWFGVGPLATGRALLRHLQRTDPERHREPSSTPTGPHPFDAEFGVETGGFIGWRELQSGGANDPYISGYIGVVPSVGRQIIGLVPDPERYVFVDLGCGKGRAAILASERSFRRVIGVEIAASLAACAEANAATIGARFPDRPAIEIVCGDAARFDFPPEPLVLFLYQPFERPVMRAVLSRLAASLAGAPRPVLVLYLYPALGVLLDRVPLFERLAAGVGWPTPAERPFSFGGRGDQEDFVVWGTRDPKPDLAPR